MRKFQKYTLLGLVFFVVVSVVVAGKYYSVWNAKKLVCATQMEKYGETYLWKYESLVQSKVIPAYQKYFTFLKEKPILIKASISTIHGAAIEFIPSKVQESQCQTITDRIEQGVFPHRDPNTFKIEFDVNNVTVLRNPGSGPLLKFGKKGNGFRNIIAITNKGWFLDLLEEASLITEAINVDGIGYPNTIIIKGSNRRSAWSCKAAKEDAPAEFYSDFQWAYFTSEEFREFCATPELTQIANEIIAKEKNGEYGGQYGYFKKIEDITKLDTVADVHGIKHEFTKNILAFLKEQPSWWDIHYIVRDLVKGLMITFLAGFLIWCFRWIWQKLSLSQRFSVWWCKKKISN